MAYPGCSPHHLERCCHTWSLLHSHSYERNPILHLQVNAQFHSVLLLLVRVRNGPRPRGRLLGCPDRQVAHPVRWCVMSRVNLRHVRILGPHRRRSHRVHDRGRPKQSRLVVQWQRDAFDALRGVLGAPCHVLLAEGGHESQELTGTTNLYQIILR